MPFKSLLQRKWMYSNKPKMAKKWEKHTPKGKKLPKKVKKKIVKDNFERLIDQVLQVLVEEDYEINLGQSSKRIKFGATSGVSKGATRQKHQSDRPKSKRRPKRQPKKNNSSKE